MCDSDYNLLGNNNRRAFTLLELMGALLIIVIITSSVVITMNRCMDATMNYKLRGQAFQIARDNMELLLNTKSLSESAEFGISELHPAIQWETVVEVFTEPVRSSMWLQARSSASYMDSSGKLQTIEFTEWITALSRAQQNLVEEQRQREQDALEELGENPFGNDAPGMLKYANYLANNNDYASAIEVLKQLVLAWPDSDEYDVAIAKAKQWAHILSNIPSKGSSRNNTDTNVNNDDEDVIEETEPDSTPDSADFECPDTISEELCQFFKDLIDGKIK